MTSNRVDLAAPGGERRSDLLVLLGVAAAVALFHVLTNGRYGFHRDELQFLADARHLDWGFVEFPPLTPFVERIGLSLFGVSLVGLRLFSVLAQAVLIFVAGLTARELGGGRLAQAVTALAVAFSPLPVFEATEFQYTSFEMLWWVLIAYFVVRLLKSEDTRWWLAIGAVIGLGLETKYSIVFYVAGILAGLAFTRARRYFASGWFWGGVGVALLLFLPNLIWLIRHDFISYTFLQHIHARDVGEGRADGFLQGQFLYDANVAAAPLWVAGLVGFAVSRRYRMLAWMYAVPVGIFWVSKGRFYYTAGAYPMLLAMGAVMAERWLGGLPRWRRAAAESVWVAAFVVVSAVVCARLMPLASSGPLKAYALRHSSDLREEIGWNELVRTVAGIRDSLPPDERAHLGITTGNYGEYGAIAILGRKYGLPEPIGTTNTEWYWGYPTPAPTTIIVLGLRREQADRIFTGCRLAGHNGNSQGVRNEESEYHPDIFLCGPLRFPWAEAWKRHRDFG